MIRIKLYFICLVCIAVSSCRKEHCFKCRDVARVYIFISGEDTIKVITSSEVYPDLSGKGYTLDTTYNYQWQPNYITYCNEDGYKTFRRDSCEQIK